MVEAAPHVDADVAVDTFEQVPGAGVAGVCHIGTGPPVLVRFGALDWVTSFLTDPAAIEALHAALGEAHARPARALAFISVGPVLSSGFSDTEDEDGATASSSSSGGAASELSNATSMGSVTSLGSSYSGLSDPAAVAPDLLDDAPVGGGAAAPPPERLYMLCFEDALQPGVVEAVRQLRTGDWAAANGGRWLPRLFGGGGGSDPNAAAAAAGAKRVVMLTGDNARVAATVAAAVGIEQYRAALKPEEKLDYVRAASEAALIAERTAGGGDGGGAAVAAAALLGGGRRSGRGRPTGLLMAGDGINDAPALAAATVGVAIASTPSDMVAAAADVIVLNGQGIANLPWLFHVAQRTEDVVRQNLALALLSVVVATVPTVAGFFPLWLAVTLHEGSTLLVALNSLRLLLEAAPAQGERPGAPLPAPPPPAASAGAAAAGDASGDEGGGAWGAKAVRADSGVQQGSWTLPAHNGHSHDRHSHGHGHGSLHQRRAPTGADADASGDATAPAPATATHTHGKL